MSLSQPSRVIVVEPVQVPVTAEPPPEEPARRGEPPVATPVPEQPAARS